MPTITTNVDIAASPEEVRKAFLDFETYPTWSKSHLIGIQVTSGDANDLKPGDKLKVTLKGASFAAQVLTNTPKEFKWRGSLPIVFTGDHSFQFQASPVVSGHTLLVQEEEFSGLLSFLLAPGWSQGEKTKAGFEAFNRELKERVENGGT